MYNFSVQFSLPLGVGVCFLSIIVPSRALEGLITNLSSCCGSCVLKYFIKRQTMKFSRNLIDS